LRTPACKSFVIASFIPYVCQHSYVYTVITHLMDNIITNPAFDYDSFGQPYSSIRKADPDIATYVYAALSNAATVLNVGAGAGSYEPYDRYVVAVEPSAVMRSQRKGRVPALIGTADTLPFDDGAFDASMAMVTVHHWPDMARGLREMRRVTSGQVVIMSFDPAALDDFWMAAYAPELINVEKQRYPSIEFLTSVLGSHCEVQKIPVTLSCTDGFQEAFYGRPEAFLQKTVRQSQSAWGFLSEEVEQAIVKRLSDDLASGAWDRKYGHLRTQPSMTCALRLVIARS
jgi:SAM-dependent methyltransferase